MADTKTRGHMFTCSNTFSVLSIVFGHLSPSMYLERRFHWYPSADMEMAEQETETDEGE